jgi:hypothetical protein
MINWIYPIKTHGERLGASLRLTHIRRGTAPTDNTRSQKRRNFILERKERRDAFRGAKDKSNVEMRISSIAAKSVDLGANLNRV